jgi:hypothetical protein
MGFLTQTETRKSIRLNKQADDLLSPAESQRSSSVHQNEPKVVSPPAIEPEVEVEQPRKQSVVILSHQALPLVNPHVQSSNLQDLQEEEVSVTRSDFKIIGPIQVSIKQETMKEESSEQNQVTQEFIHSLPIPEGDIQSSFQEFIPNLNQPRVSPNGVRIVRNLRGVNLD